MAESDKVEPGMEIVGNDGKFIGVVDGIENNIELRLRCDDSKIGIRHFLPLATVEHVDNRVHLNRSSIRAMAEWR